MATSETQPKAAPDKSVADKDTSKSPSSNKSVRDERTKTADGSVSLADEVREAHNARTTVPGAPGVDARLDNRQGDQRPQHTDEVKPQQIDGPDITQQTEWTRKFLAERKTAEQSGPVVGMFSPGPHGKSNESMREGGPDGVKETRYGTEGLTEAELKASENTGK